MRTSHVRAGQDSLLAGPDPLHSRSRFTGNLSRAFSAFAPPIHDPRMRSFVACLGLGYLGLLGLGTCPAPGGVPSSKVVRLVPASPPMTPIARRTAFSIQRRISWRVRRRLRLRLHHPADRGDELRDFDGVSPGAPESALTRFLDVQFVVDPCRGRTRGRR
jgi:hypothetical protein